MNTIAIVDDSSTTLEMTEPIPPLLEGICILRIGAWHLGVAGRHCLGLQWVASAAPVPRSPAHVLGVTYHQGRVIPVLDLGLALEISRGSRRGDPRAVGLVVEADGTAGVLAADEVVTFESLDLRQLREIEAPEPASFRRFGWGRLQHCGHDVVVLEIATLLEAIRLRDGDETIAGRKRTRTT